MNDPEATPIPVFVLTGYLGSGKTTLLNQLIQNERFADAAIIINEFGEIGLDHHLVEAGDDGIIELSNGCLCCTVCGQLVDTLEKLVTRSPTSILIETTGLADPVPVLEALIRSASLTGSIRFSGLITVLDAVNGTAVVERQQEAKRQIMLADCVVISKLDLADEASSGVVPERIRQLVRTLNPSAPIVAGHQFLDDLKYYIEMTPRALSGPEEAHHHHHHHEVNRHNDRICAVQLFHDAPISRPTLDLFLDLLLSAHAAHILRLKGLVQMEGCDKPLLIQVVGSSLSPFEWLTRWPDDKPQTAITVFTEDMDPEFIRKLFAGFINSPRTDTPDRQALTENPLAIPGQGKSL